MATECYDDTCPLHAKIEPIGDCSMSEEVRLLCKDRQRLQRELELEKVKRREMLEETDERIVYFHCVHCNESVTYSQTYIERLIIENERSGAVWWQCPVCGINDYFEDVLRRSYNENRELGF